MSKWEKYREASERGLRFLLSQMGENGGFHDPVANDDVASIYKLPNQLTGNALAEKRTFNFIKEKFLQPNGDFLSYPDKTGRERKSTSWPVTYYWAYVNGWITLSAQRAGRFDISFPAFHYILSFWCPIQNAFTWFEPFDSDKAGKGIDQSLCVFQTAHLGSVCLYCGDLAKAKLAGDFIIKTVKQQPNLDEEFFLKVHGDTGKVVTSDIPEDKAVFFTVKRKVGGQLYFQLGYPIIFLHRLYKTTGDDKYLDTSRKILDFARSCHDDVYTFPMSHKVMYGAALVAASTHNADYRDMAEKIGDNILKLQADDGRFQVGDSLMEQLDQTSENVGWFRNVYVELSLME